VAPFAAFMVLLAAQSYVPLPQAWEFALRIVLLSFVLWFFSRRVLDLGMSRPLGTVMVGALVFVLWVGPDALFPGYRSHWLFSNPLFGAARTRLSAEAAQSPVALLLRSIRAIVLVPMLEELFWRGWLMRWIIRQDFLKVPLGTYAPKSFWIVALLFAAEHGPYWDVGLMAGIVYNYWMCKTRRLGDLIWAHAITNGLLCLYVIYTHKWEFWL
jgi:CAAX prenyl protease-like protein